MFLRKWLLIGMCLSGIVALRGRSNEPGVAYAGTSLASAYGAVLGADITAEIAQYRKGSVFRNVGGFITAGHGPEYVFEPSEPITLVLHGDTVVLGRYCVLVTPKNRIYKIRVDHIREHLGTVVAILESRYGKLPFRKIEKPAADGCDQAAELIDPKNPARKLIVKKSQYQLIFELYDLAIEKTDSGS